MISPEVLGVIRKIQAEHLGHEVDLPIWTPSQEKLDWRVEITSEEVSPEQAMEYIAASWSSNYAPTDIVKIKRYADLMRRGEWTSRPEDTPIVLKENRVCDGRHRLHAILLSGQTVRCNVKRKYLTPQAEQV